MNILFSNLIQITIDLISKIGYLGIFFGMFLESTIFPIPSEAIMIPAGIYAGKGLANIYLIIFYGVLGNVCGAIFSYYVSLLIGRRIIEKVGKYFFVKESTIDKIEKFFEKYGSVSVFIGRLLPGFRHFISIPAGIAKMNIKTFIFYTTIGSAIWTSILAFAGFFIAKNQEIIQENIHKISLICLIVCLISIISYFFYKQRK